MYVHLIGIMYVPCMVDRVYGTALCGACFLPLPQHKQRATNALAQRLLWRGGKLHMPCGQLFTLPCGGSLRLCRDKGWCEAGVLAHPAREKGLDGARVLVRSAVLLGLRRHWIGPGGLLPCGHAMWASVLSAWWRGSLVDQHCNRERAVDKTWKTCYARGVGAVQGPVQGPHTCSCRSI